MAQCAPLLAGHPLPPGSLTLSAGVASVLLGNLGDVQVYGEALFHAADEALYQAKEQGRDTVYAQSYSSPLIPELINGDERQHPNSEAATEIATEATAYTSNKINDAP